MNNETKRETRSVIWVDFDKKQVIGRLRTVNNLISIATGFIPLLQDEICDIPTDPKGEDNAS